MTRAGTHPRPEATATTPLSPLDSLIGRWTGTSEGQPEFEDVFELSAPGKPFEVYSRSRLKRVK
jgi:hypothetical protein